jgi:arylsulfatase A-like enzyme
MYGPWDGPLELQESLLDEEDPPPMEDVASPELDLTQLEDPDLAFRCSCAYAAQIMVLDTCWAALMDTVAAASQASPWLVVLIGVRGFPLGEHQRIGGVDQRLYSEQLHIPWIVRFPDRRGALVRSHALTSHVDLLPTILDFIDKVSGAEAAGIDGMSVLPLVAAESAAWRDWLMATSHAGNNAIRTANWCLRQGAVTSPLTAPVRASDTDIESPSCELFVRPDDRWEANDVAKLCPEVVEQLTHAIGDVLQSIAEGNPMPRSITSLAN